MAQAPVLNALYRMVANDPNLKSKIKFVAAAQGQGQICCHNVEETSTEVPFAVVPDTDSKLSSAMNFGFPVTMLVDKSGTVLWVDVGRILEMRMRL